MIDDSIIIPATQTTVTEIFAKQEYKIKDPFSAFDTHHRQLLIDSTTLKGVPISRAWAVLFSTTSDFYYNYHIARKETDIDVAKWTLAADRSNGQRMFHCLTPVDSSKTPFSELQRFAFVRKDSGALLLAIHFSASTPEVPFGTSFRVETFIEISSDDDKGDSVIAIYGTMRKISMAFSMIRAMALPRGMKSLKGSYVLFMQCVSKALLNGSLAIQEPPTQIEEEATALPPSRFDLSLLLLGVLGLILTVSIVLSSVTLSSLKQPVITLHPPDSFSFHARDSSQAEKSVSQRQAWESNVNETLTFHEFQLRVEQEISELRISLNRCWLVVLVLMTLSFAATIYYFVVSKSYFYCSRPINTCFFRRFFFNFRK